MATMPCGVEACPPSLSLLSLSSGREHSVHVQSEKVSQMMSQAIASQAISVQQTKCPGPAIQDTRTSDADCLPCWMLNL